MASLTQPQNVQPLWGRVPDNKEGSNPIGSLLSQHRAPPTDALSGAKQALNLRPPQPQVVGEDHRRLEVTRDAKGEVTHVNEAGLA